MEHAIEKDKTHVNRGQLTQFVNISRGIIQSGQYKNSHDRQKFLGVSPTVKKNTHKQIEGGITHDIMTLMAEVTDVGHRTICSKRDCVKAKAVFAVTFT